jgi:hypothetical protein
MSVRLLPWVLSLALAGCGGSDTSPGHGGRDGSGGGAGESHGGNAGASAGRGGSAGVETGESGQGGDGTTTGHAGAEAAGSSGAESATSGSGGSGEEAGETGAGPNGPLDWVPPENGSWLIPSGDALNATPPALAPSRRGIVLAGATSDPTLAGLPIFEAGVEAEAFVAELDLEGEALFRVALADAGVPNSVVVAGDGNIFVLAAFLPDSPSLFPGQYSDAGYLAKIGPTGTLIYERELPFDGGTILSALAVDPSGAIYVAGSQLPDDDFPNEYVFLAKYDDQGNELWTKPFEHVGSTAYISALSLEPGGEPIVAGVFNGSMNLGGAELVSDALVGASMFPNGFLARFTPMGEHVYSARFGGTVFDGGTALMTLADGDLLLAGFLSGVSGVGGSTVNADVDEGSAFLARLDATGGARWVELAGTGTSHSIVKDADESDFYVVGNLGGSEYLAQFGADGTPGTKASVTAGSLVTHAAAVDALGSIWISGSFTGELELGNGNVWDGGAAGVCLIRLDRSSNP